MKMSIYFTHPNEMASNFYSLRISSPKKMPIFRHQDDYRQFMSIIADCTDEFRSISRVLPIMFCLQQNDVVIVVRASSKSASEYLDRLVDCHHKRQELPVEIVKSITAIEEHSLLKISTLIHTLDDDWLNYEFSSARAYLYDDYPEWLYTKPFARIRGSATQYLRYLQSSTAA